MTRWFYFFQNKKKKKKQDSCHLKRQLYSTRSLIRRKSMKLAPVQPLVVWLVLAPRAPGSITKSMESGHHRIQVDMWDDVFPDFVISTDCGEEVFHWQVLNPALIVLEVLKFPAVQCNTSEVCRHQVLAQCCPEHHPSSRIFSSSCCCSHWQMTSKSGNQILIKSSVSRIQ